MNSRERVIAQIEHKETDTLALDVGGTLVTSIHVSTLHKLKKTLGLIVQEEPVRLIDPFMMLGEVDDDLRRALGIDTIPLLPRETFFGFRKENWREWRFFDGTPLLVPGKFNTTPDSSGDIYQYPMGDRTAPPSAKMPANGFYHDAVIRQRPIHSENDLAVEDQIAEFTLLSDEDLLFFEREAQRLFEETECAVISGGVPGINIGDIGLLPAFHLRDPGGVRDFEEWYVSFAMRKNFLKEAFEQAVDIGFQNLERFRQAVGDRVQVILVSAADFGSQHCPLFSHETYRELFLPLHKKVNEWIHSHTSWKTFIHTCGAVYDLLPDFAEAGFDILNPVQISADGMDPQKLQTEWGDQFVFWGGGVNTQTILPFGSPREVREEVKSLIETFRPGGGFVFAAVHNIQANIPVENVLALFEAVQEYR